MRAGARSAFRNAREVWLVSVHPIFGCPTMFFFFSNRLGCFGSLLISVIITLALLFMFGMLRF